MRSLLVTGGLAPTSSTSRAAEFLRLEGWNGQGERLPAVELPLRTFLNRLDIDVRDVDLPGRYLIFAGQGRPGGGARDLRGVFDCEEEAWSAFHEFRTERAPSSWAELVFLDHRGRAKALCWFDADATATAAGSENPPETRQRRVRPSARRKIRRGAST